jgi:hypothetical protein
MELLVPAVALAIAVYRRVRTGPERQHLDRHMRHIGDLDDALQLPRIVSASPTIHRMTASFRIAQNSALPLGDRIAYSRECI